MMIKNSVIFSMILLLLSTTAVSAYDIIRQKPYYRTPDYYYNRVLPNDLSALEKYSMNRTYSGDHPKKRLERLEQLAFGAVQEGGIEPRYRNVEAAILARPKYNNTKRTLANSIANYFAGQPTGYTPQIGNGNNYFMPSIPSGSQYNSRYEQYSNGLFGGGYSLLNSGFGSGSSVRILD